MNLTTSLRPLDGLKDIKRQGWLYRGVPEVLCESVYDHSWNCVRAAFHYTGDRRLIEMMVVHDWAEVGVGDITPHDNVPLLEKYEMEREVMVGLTGGLQLGSHIMGLWEEFEACKTPRAMLGKQLDKLDAAVKALVYEHMGYDTSEFFSYTRERLQDERLLDVFDSLMRREHDLLDSHQVYFGMLGL